MPITGRLIYLSIQRDGFRPIELYLFTTLLDENLYTIENLAELYSLRWHAELNLRYLKATLSMKQLNVKSVDMARKELLATLLAYNIVRAYMTKVALEKGVSPLTLSFTTCLRRIHILFLLKSFSIYSSDIELIIPLVLGTLVECKLPKRKRFRIEPRALRRLPATYPNLKGSRALARQKLIEQLLL